MTIENSKIRITPKKDRTEVSGYKYVALSSLIRIITFPITAVATLISTYLTIGYAGATTFAAIAIIATIQQLVPYTDLGIGSGVINAVSTSKDDSNTLNAIASALRVLIVSAIIVLIGGTLLTSTISWKEVLHLGDSNIGNIQIAFLGMIAVIAISIPLGVGQRVLTGLLRNPLAVGIGAIAPIVGLVITFAIVFFKMPVTLLVFPATLGSLCSAAVATIVALRQVSFKVRYIIDFKKFRFPGLVRNGLWYMLIMIMSAFTLQYGRIILAARSDLSEVASFSLSIQMYAPLWSVFITAGTALWPIFARRRADKVDNQLRSVLITIGYFVLAGVVCLIGLASLGPWAASILSKGLIHASPWLLASAGVLIVVQGAQLVLGVYLTSPTDFRFQALCGVVVAGSTVFGSWYLAPAMGASAPFFCAAISILLFNFIPCLIRLIYSFKYKNHNSLSI